MKKITRTLMALSAIAMIATSCSNDLEETSAGSNVLVKTSFTATQEGNETRTHLDLTSVIWNYGDKVAVHDGSQNHEFTAIEGGETYTTLDGEVSSSSDEFFAVYPYTAYSYYNSYYKNRIQISIPKNQYATADNFDPKAAVMVAHSKDSKNLAFKNVCAYIEVTTTKSYKQLTLQSEKIASTCYVYFDNNNINDINLYDATNDINLLPAEGQTSIPAGTYLIAVAPGVKTKLNVRATTMSNEVETSKTVLPAGGFTLERSKRYTLPLNLKAPVVSGKAAVKSEAGIPGNEVTWVQLWEDGPKFAAWNVGAKNDTEVGGYYCYGGIVDKDPNNVYPDFYIDNPYAYDEYDTAKRLWGDSWKVPSWGDIRDIFSKANATWTENYKEVSGLNGFVVTGKTAPYNTVSLFIPAAGQWNGTNVNYGAGPYAPWGYYWGREPYTNQYTASLCKFNKGGTGAHDSYDRSSKLSVRAILAE